MKILTNAYFPYVKALQLKGDEANDFEVKTFHYVPSQTTVKSILEAVNPFKPDLILHFQPELCGLPVDFLESPVPVIPLVLDHQMNFQSLALAAPFFKGLLLSGSHPISFFKNAGIQELEWHPSIIVDYDLISPDIDRPFDVMFVGTIDDLHSPNRTSLIKLLHQLIPEYQIGLVSGTHEEPTTTLYAKSKIVFNHAARSDVTNQRTADALASGALLFINEENGDPRQWLADKKEVIVYDHENLIPLIRYYLEHPKERVEIATAGQKQFSSYQKSFSEFDAKIRSWTERCLASPNPKASSILQLFSSGLLLTTPLSLPIPCPDESLDLNLLNNLGVSHWSCSGAFSPGSPQHQGHRQVAMDYFRRALAKRPTFLPSLWNLGIAHFYSSQWEAATSQFMQALPLVEQEPPWPFEARSIAWYGMEDLYTRQFSRLFVEEKLYGKDKSKEFRKLIYSGIYSYLVQIALNRGDTQKATQTLGEWNRRVTTDEPFRDWLWFTALQKTEPTRALQAAFRFIVQRPFLLAQEQVELIAQQLSDANLKSEASWIMTHLQKHHLASELSIEKRNSAFVPNHSP